MEELVLPYDGGPPGLLLAQAGGAHAPEILSEAENCAVGIHFRRASKSPKGARPKGAEPKRKARFSACLPFGYV